MVLAEYEGAEVCVKKFVVSMDPLENSMKFEMEASIFGSLNHPNIVKVTISAHLELAFFLSELLCARIPNFARTRK